MRLFPRRLAIVRTTVPDERTAHAMAKALVDEKLAACVQCYPVYSVYEWKGKREGQTEWAVEAKTTSGGAGRLEERMLQAHPYELPAMESTATTSTQAYADWVHESVRS